MALEATLDLDSPAPVSSVCLTVTDLAALARLEVSALVPALSLDPTLDPGGPAAVSEQAVVLEAPASARQADLVPLSPAWEEVPEAVSPPWAVDKYLPCRALEAFTADTLHLTGASHRAQATLVLATTTVVMDFPDMATAMMLMVWAAASG